MDSVGARENECILLGHGGLVEMHGAAWRSASRCLCISPQRGLALSGAALSMWNAPADVCRVPELMDGSDDLGKAGSSKRKSSRKRNGSSSLIFQESLLGAAVEADLARMMIRILIPGRARPIALYFDDKTECAAWFDALQVASTYRFSTHYELGPLLGSGSFAEVRMCRDRASGQRFAVKRIRLTHYGQPDDALMREVRIGLDLHHENIVEFRDAFVEPRAIYIVQEYVPAGTLRELLAQDISEDIVRILVRQVVRAVAYLHLKGVIHRDLKLSNLLLSADITDPASLLRSDLVKVADLGLSNSCLASIFGEEAVFHSVVGSPRYIAPEVVDGSGYTFSADMWSVGVIAYALLSRGLYPIRGSSKKELLTRVRSGTIEPMQGDSWALVSDDAKSFVARLLEADPKRRLSAEQALEHPWLK